MVEKIDVDIIEVEDKNPGVAWEDGVLDQK